ncbi:MAG TPA: ABC transporter substrate-binding protein [Chloroflexia bacterium]|nr:ABC transporter substrate-binding protein [Chloroflexia bacterium]
MSRLFKTTWHHLGLCMVLCLVMGLVLTACGSSTDTVAPAATTASATTAAATTAAATTSAAAGAATTTAAAGAATTAAAPGAIPPPAVPNAAAAKKFSGQTITVSIDSAGPGAQTDQQLVDQFTKDTGIVVKSNLHPDSASDYYASLTRLFQGKSNDIDVMTIDVIWPGAFAPNLLDLTPVLGDTANKLLLDTAVQNDTIGGKLVAMPFFGDFGILYYRTDLLKKYGFSAPPKTWDELEQQAKKIQDGEKASNPQFAGFVWQGKAYEGLTCDALEWIASSGGGTIIDQSGKVTLNNPNAVKALNRAKGWIGTISPTGVTSYQEEDARNVWGAGNAAFMRNWPYAYSLSADPTKSKVAGNFDVAPLPADSGSQPSGTLGGWQMAVNKYTKNPDASIEFVRYMTSNEVSKWRAVTGSYVPLNKEVLNDPDVIKTNPYLASTKEVVRVVRPSRTTGVDYNEVSTYFFQGVAKVLAGQDASSVLSDVQNKIQGVLK